MVLPDPLHPFLVHLPVLLTPLCLMISLVALFYHRFQWTMLLLLSMLLDYFLIFLCNESGLLDAEKWGAGPYGSHMKWATFTKIMVLLSIIPIIVQCVCTIFEKKKGNLLFGLVTFLLLIVTNISLYITTIKGHQLVYKYGLGIKKESIEPKEPSSSAKEVEKK